MRTLRVNCVDGITANRERLGAMVGSSVGVITALTPFIGYAAAAALAETALLTGRNVAELVVEAGLMTREEVTKQLSPARLSGLEAVTAAIPIVRAGGRRVTTRTSLEEGAARSPGPELRSVKRSQRSSTQPPPGRKDRSDQEPPIHAAPRRQPRRPPTAADAARRRYARRAAARARVRRRRRHHPGQDDGHRRAHPVVLRPARRARSWASSPSCRASGRSTRTAGRWAIIISCVLMVIGIIVAIL